MKQRLITLALALGALFCFYALFVPKPNAAAAHSEPLSTDAGENGYLAAWRWLSAQQVPLVSLQDRYTSLRQPEVAPSASGNLLIMTLPQRLPLQAAEVQALESWLADGNTLLILAALDDTPQWTFEANPNPRPALDRISHMTFSTDEKSSPPLSQWLRARTMESVPQGQHVLTQGVQTLYAISDLPASRWRAYNSDGMLSLRLAHLSDANHGALWLKSAGGGQLIVSAFASLLSNRALDHADNARLLSNIIAWSRSGAGRVIFDDAHQGLVRFYDAGTFFADPRLHHTLLWMVLLWLLFVLGSAAAASRATMIGAAVDETALLEASGRFYTRAVDPLRCAAGACSANFFESLRAAHRAAAEAASRCGNGWTHRRPLSPAQRARAAAVVRAHLRRRARAAAAAAQLTLRTTGTTHSDNALQQSGAAPAAGAVGQRDRPAKLRYARLPSRSSRAATCWCRACRDWARRCWRRAWRRRSAAASSASRALPT